MSKVVFTETVEPDAPDTGKASLYIDSSDQELKLKKSDGTVNGFFKNEFANAPLSGNTDDLDIGTASVVRLSSTAAVLLTGIQAPTTIHSSLITLFNVGSDLIQLGNNEADSSAANRMLLGNTLGVVLLPDDFVQLIYDSTSNRWRLSAGPRPYDPRFVFEEKGDFSEGGDGLLASISENGGTNGGLAGPNSGLAVALLRHTTSTNAAGAAGWRGAVATHSSSTDTIQHCSIGLITGPNLSDGTNTYTLRAGMRDASSGNGVDGIFFRYVHSENSGNWTCVTRAASTSTTSNSGITVAVSTYYHLQIQVVGTLARFFINGSFVAEQSTNVPTGANKYGPFGFSITKSVGTTSRQCDTDYHHAIVFTPGKSGD